jgi:membrane protein DedA with SNARE-associated domain
MNFLTAEQIGGIVRAVVAAAGGYFVGQGLVDAETMTTIGGAVTTLIVAVWSVLKKKAA